MFSFKFLNVINVIPRRQSITIFTFSTFSKQQTTNNYTSSVSPFEKSGRNRISPKTTTNDTNNTNDTNDTNDTEGIDSFLLNYANKQKDNELRNVKESNN